MNITAILIGALILLTGVVAVLLVLLLKRMKPIETDASEDKTALLLQGQLQDLARRVDQQSASSAKMLQDQHFESTKLSRDTVERLTKIDEAARQVLSASERLQELERILKNPKQRGVLGEYFLETLLKNVFPPGMYQMQYPFKDGTIVDAAIIVKDKIIPIDSKFSLENYNRIIEERDSVERERLEKVFKQDLKNRIDETAKYVRPDEGTMDFAFMFIPAEGIYYDLLVNQVGAVKTNTRDLIDYAFIEKKVHIVSPTTLLSHLKMVLQGLRAMQIEESTKEIRGNVEKLEKHLAAYHQYMTRLGSNLGTTVNAYNMANAEFGKIDKDVMKITGVKRDLLEAASVEKPRSE